MPDFFSDLVIDHGGKTLIASTAVIETVAISEPDPSWVWTDDAGHEHHATESAEGYVTYPTLEVVNSAAKWCQSCQDVHPEVWFECRQCRQKTLPGIRSGLPRMIAGPTIYMIDDDEVTRDQAEEFMAAWQRDQDDANNDPGDPHGMLSRLPRQGDLPGMG